MLFTKIHVTSKHPYISVEYCKIPEVTHGKVSQARLPIGTPVQIMCDAGYYDPYEGDVMCTMAGTISHSNIVCQCEVYFLLLNCLSI